MNEARVAQIGDIVVLVYPVEGPTVNGDAEAVDLVAAAFSAEADLVALPVSRLTPDFFSLSTGVAGQIVQKLVNYRLRLAIIGDISEWLAESAALRAFVAEANRGKQLWFVADSDELAARCA